MRASVRRLPAPQTIITASFAAAIVSMPTLMPKCGTADSVPNAGKVIRLSRRVSSDSGMIRVRLSRGLPGGLNATCPSLAPDASMKKSIPPASAMRASYAAGSRTSGNQIDSSRTR